MVPANVTLDSNVAKEDEYVGLTEDEKSERLLERAFGKNPYKNKPQPVTGDKNKDQNENHPQISQIDADLKEPQPTTAKVTLNPNSKDGKKESTANDAKNANQPNVTPEPVETIEDYERRQREAEEHRRWVERQMRIRDKVNGTEFSFNPYV